MTHNNRKQKHISRLQIVISNLQVRDVHIDTRAKGTVYPYHRSLLYTLKHKDPISRENGFHVSYCKLPSMVIHKTQ